MNSIITCPYCGSTNTHLLHSSFCIESRTTNATHVCEECHKLIFQESTGDDPMPTAQKLEDAADHHEAALSDESRALPTYTLNNFNIGDPYIVQGWQCPKCKSILAPHIDYCPFCSTQGLSSTKFTCDTTNVRG